MIPYHLYGWYQQALVGSVNKSQCWTKAYHIQLWVALREQTALQSGVDTANDWFLTKQFDVALAYYLLQLAVGLHLPCGISVARSSLGTGQLECGTDCGTHVVEVRHYVRALARQNLDAVLR